jgi:hypothetical protein
MPETSGQVATAESVSDPGFCDNVFWFGGILFHLLAQGFHERAKVIELTAIFRAPDRSQEFRVRYWNSRVPHQQRQQFELGGSEMDGFSLPIEHVAIDIKLQFASLQ